MEPAAPSPMMASTVALRPAHTPCESSPRPVNTTPTAVRLDLVIEYNRRGIPKDMTAKTLLRCTNTPPPRSITKGIHVEIPTMAPVGEGCYREVTGCVAKCAGYAIVEIAAYRCSTGERDEQRATFLAALPAQGVNMKAEGRRSWWKTPWNAIARYTYCL